MLTNEEKIKQWSNNAKRHEFISNYKVWDTWVLIKELDMTLYKFEFSSSQWFVAAEYKSKTYSNGSGYETRVFYYIHDPAHPFWPQRRQKYELVNLLKIQKMHLLSETKAGTGNK